jgi:hypothetical protein
MIIADMIFAHVLLLQAQRYADCSGISIYFSILFLYIIDHE